MMIRILLVTFFLAISPLVLAKQHSVSECGTVIDEPGKYRVVNDIDCPPLQDGILITASDVTLDLKGHTITCGLNSSPIPYAAVIVGWDLPVENVWVHNGTVRGCNDGVLLGFTDGVRVNKMHMSNNSDAGITLVAAENSVIKNNDLSENGTAIRSFWGQGNLFSHNIMMLGENGVLVRGETDSMITCNTASQLGFGIEVAPYSTGNVIRGNNTDSNFVGIWAYGTVNSEMTHPMAEGNLFRHNSALNNLASDLAEVFFDQDGGFPFVDPADECQNAWMKNEFDNELGPSDCIGLPVMLDEKEVCAFDKD